MDGRDDIITGDREGNVYYFRRLSAGNIFLVQEPLVNVGGRPIDIGLNSSPSVVYFNGDSLPDLVVGMLDGYLGGLFLYLNTGSPGVALFDSVDTLECAGEPIQLYASYPDFHDLTGNGLQDMIVGNTSGMIPCFINTGTPDMPDFQSFEYLMADGDTIDLNTYVRPSICNWNQDGVPDLLVSDYTGGIYLYTGVPGTGLQQQGPETSSEDQLLRVFSPGSGGVLGFLIRSPCSGEMTFNVYSIEGRRVLPGYRLNVAEGESAMSIPLKGLSPGVYVLETSASDRRAVCTFTLLP